MTPSLRARSLASLLTLVIVLAEGSARPDYPSNLPVVAEQVPRHHHQQCRRAHRR